MGSFPLYIVVGGGRAGVAAGREKVGKWGLEPQRRELIHDVNLADFLTPNTQQAETGWAQFWDPDSSTLPITDTLCAGW